MAACARAREVEKVLLQLQEDGSQSHPTCVVLKVFGTNYARVSYSCELRFYSHSSQLFLSSEFDVQPLNTHLRKETEPTDVPRNP